MVEQRKGVRRRVTTIGDQDSARRRRVARMAHSVRCLSLPDARPHRFAAFLLLASSASSPSWNQPLCDDLGGDKGGDLQLDLEGKGSSLVNAFSVVENAKSQKCSSLSTQMFGSGPVKATQKDSLYDATQVDEDDPRAQGRQVRLQTQLLFAADHVVPPKTTGDVLEDEAQLSRRLAATYGAVRRRYTHKKEETGEAEGRHVPVVCPGRAAERRAVVGGGIRPLMALSLRDGPIAAPLFGQLVGTLYNARPLATRRRVVVGLENALRSCEESPTHELGAFPPGPCCLHRCIREK